MYKPIKIKTLEGDAHDFIQIVEELINRLIVQEDIAEIKLIKIKNWFDHKWLNFSGKGMIPFSETLHPDKIALKNLWRDKITVPPFTPNRILSEIRYHRKQTGNKMFEHGLHKWQRSTENQNNKISDKSENGLFIWYSSDTEKNQQGSIMGYRVDDREVHTWLVSVENRNGWKVTKTKGINRDELKDLGK